MKSKSNITDIARLSSAEGYSVLIGRSVDSPSCFQSDGNEARSDRFKRTGQRGPISETTASIPPRWSPSGFSVCGLRSAILNYETHRVTIMERYVFPVRTKKPNDSKRRTVNSLLTLACRTIILEKGCALFPCEVTCEASAKRCDSDSYDFSRRAARDKAREIARTHRVILLINRCGSERRKRKRAGDLAWVCKV